MQVRAGTSGYSYKEWRGVFYPDDLAQDQWLSFYASKLPSVEINNTFYRMPRTHVVEAWRDSVPDDFRFVIKASRRITHQSRLNNAAESVGYLLKSVEVLGSKLGAVLFQLPPNMRADLDRLRSFQELLPETLPVAFEFRHESWFAPAVEEALSSRDHARVVSHDGDGDLDGDGDGDGAVAAAEILAGPLTYLRLRAPDYTEAALKKWHRQLELAGTEDAFVFFKHEDAGAGPAMAARFMAIASQPDALEAPGRRAVAGRAGPRAAVGPRAAPRKAAQSKASTRKAPKKTS